MAIEALAAVGAVAGGGTGIITVIFRLITKMMENKAQKQIMKRELNEHHLKLLEFRYKNAPWQAWLGTFMLLGSSLGVLGFLTVYAVYNPDVPMNYPFEHKDLTLKLLGFDVITFPSSGKVTWETLYGGIFLPIWIMIASAGTGLFIGRRITD